MKRDFQQSTNAAASEALIDWVLLAQAFRPIPERSTFHDHQSFYRETKTGHYQRHLDHYQDCQDSGERVARQLGSALSQPPLDASLLTGANKSLVTASSTSAPNPVLRLVKGFLANCRSALRGLCAPLEKSGNLEQALSDMIRELSPATANLRAFITGKPQVLKPEIHDQVCMIGREALFNALRHSHATLVEVEVEYQLRNLRLIIRDNGCGMDPEVVNSTMNSHNGLVQMNEKARILGAQLCIWSRLGLGTEIEFSLPY